MTRKSKTQAPICLNTLSQFAKEVKWCANNSYEPFVGHLNGLTDVCSKVTPVKSIYLLNVVVK